MPKSMDWIGRRTLAIVAGLCVAGVASGQGAEPATAVTYGALPEGASAIAEASGIGAEICRDLLLNPTQIAQELPAGYRLLTARELAKDDPGLQQLLSNATSAGPAHDVSGHALGSLCFISVGNALVEGVRVHGPGPTPQAFLWARAEGPRDPRMLGKLQWVQLASWYARDVLDRGRVLASDPTAEFVDLQMSLIGPNRWSMQLPLATERVTVDVTGNGQRIARKAPQPGFMSVVMSGAGVDQFQVFTYFGHHHQDAHGVWRSQGTGLFSSALAIPGEEAALGTFMQDGWQARYGVYRIR